MSRAASEDSLLCLCGEKKSNNSPAYRMLHVILELPAGSDCPISTAFFEASKAFWLVLHFMLHRNEQIFVKVELPSVLSAGKMLLQLIVDLGWSGSTENGWHSLRAMWGDATFGGGLKILSDTGSTWRSMDPKTFPIIWIRFVQNT